MLDKSIEMNLKLIKDDIIALLGVGTVITVFTLFQSLFTLFAPLAFLIFTCVMTYKVYYKILYKTVFGDGNALYGALPVTAEEHIWSKVITILIFQIIDVVFTVVCFFVATKFGAMVYFQDLALNLLEMLYNETGMMVEFLMGIVFWISIIAQLIIVFYMCVLFNRRGGRSKKGFFIVFALYFTFNLILQRIPYLGIKYLMVILCIVTVIEIIAGIYFYKKLLKYFKSDYVPG